MLSGILTVGLRDGVVYGAVVPDDLPSLDQSSYINVSTYIDTQWHD